MAATVLLKMAAYTGETPYHDRAEEALASLAGMAAAAPVMSGQWLTAALLAEQGLTEVAIVGDLDRPTAVGLVGIARQSYRPLLALAARRAGAQTDVPILRGREPAPGQSAAAWVCRQSTCSVPTDEPEEFARLLGP
jgi:uncharacterized protein YyaL (SSP411 family)